MVLTATWEYWSGERSRVHNCYNGIGTWFYQAMGGLRRRMKSIPGYQRCIHSILQIPRGLTWAKMATDTPDGRDLLVDWELTENTYGSSSG